MAIRVENHATAAETALGASALLWGVVFSSIGFGFLLYGWKQRVIVPLVCGLALMGCPYVVPGTGVLVGIGIVLTAIPYFVRI